MAGSRDFGSIGLIVILGLLSGCATAPGNSDQRDGTELVGTRWLVEDIGGRGVMDMLQSTIEFESTERALANAGCNRAFGNVAISGSEIEFGAFGVTRMACPESVMDQENRYLQALGATRRYRVDEASDLLYFFAEDGHELLRFGRMSGE